MVHFQPILNNRRCHVFTSETLAIIASLTHIVAFLVYNKQILGAKNAPNISTWAIWGLLSFFNVASYWTMSGDWAKSLLPMISSFLCVATFFVSLGRGHFATIGKYDLAALFIGVVAVAVWLWFKSATFANMLAQCCVFIGFLPTYRSVWENPKNEKALPWFIWTLAYVFGTMVVILRWQGQWQDVVYFANCIVLHLVVALLTFRKSRKEGCYGR